MNQKKLSTRIIKNWKYYLFIKSKWRNNDKKFYFGNKNSIKKIFAIKKNDETKKYHKLIKFNYVNKWIVVPN